MSKRWYGGALGLCFLLAATTSMAESLQQAWNVALQVNHGLKAARENSSAAARQLEAAKAVRLPGLSLEAGYTMLQNEPATRANFGPAAAEFPIGERNTLSYKAMATLPLYTGGRISRGIDAAESAVRASRGQESAAIQDLKRTVAEAYVAVLRARRGVEVADSHVASLKAHARDVENMYEQGMVSRNDLLAAQVALADAEQQAIKAKNVLDLARSTYNRLLDRPLSQEVVLDDLQPGPLDEGLESLTERALGQRDELLVLRDRIRGLQDQAKAVRAETAPQFALSGGYDYRENRYTVYEGQWMVNLGLQWKLFDGGAARHKAAATERQAAALQEQRPGGGESQGEPGTIRERAGHQYRGARCRGAAYPEREQSRQRHLRCRTRRSASEAGGGRALTPAYGLGVTAVSLRWRARCVFSPPPVPGCVPLSSCSRKDSVRCCLRNHAGSRPRDPCRHPPGVRR